MDHSRRGAPPENYLRPTTAFAPAAATFGTVTETVRPAASEPAARRVGTDLPAGPHPDACLLYKPVTTGAFPFELMFGIVTATVTPAILFPAIPVAVSVNAVVVATAPPPAVIA